MQASIVCLLLVAASCGGGDDVVVSWTPVTPGTAEASTAIAPTPTAVLVPAYESLTEFVAAMTIEAGPTFGPLAIALADADIMRSPCPSLAEPFGVEAPPLSGTASFESLKSSDNAVVVDSLAWGAFVVAVEDEWEFYQEFGDTPFGGSPELAEWASESIASADSRKAIELDVGRYAGGGPVSILILDDVLAASYGEIDVLICVGYVRGGYLEACRYGPSGLNVPTAGRSVDLYSLDVRIDRYESLTGRPISSEVVTGGVGCPPSLTWDAAEGAPAWIYAEPPLSGEVNETIVATLSE